jgi:hypothetical protein
VRCRACVLHFGWTIAGCRGRATASGQMRGGPDGKISSSGQIASLARNDLN